MLLMAAIVKGVSIFVLGFAYYFKKGKFFSLFHLNLLLSILGEVIFIYGLENYPQILMIATICYFCVTILLIKNNTRLPVVKKTYLPFLLFVSLFLIYVIHTILNIVFQKTTVFFLIPIATSVTFYVATIYMAFVFIADKNLKNLWLLFNLISSTLTFVIAPVEALVLPSIYFHAITNVVSVASHFFIYKFLVTPEYKVELDEETFYL